MIGESICEVMKCAEINAECRLPATNILNVNTPHQPMKQSAYELNTLIRFEGASFEGLRSLFGDSLHYGTDLLRDCFITRPQLPPEFSFFLSSVTQLLRSAELFELALSFHRRTLALTFFPVNQLNRPPASCELRSFAGVVSGKPAFQVIRPAAIETSVCATEKINISHDSYYNSAQLRYFRVHSSGR